jgi:hypothetical protein
MEMAPYLERDGQPCQRRGIVQHHHHQRYHRCPPNPCFRP